MLGKSPNHQTTIQCTSHHLQEPMVDSLKIEKYKRKLNIQHGFYNTFNKIWILWTHEMDVSIIQYKDHSSYLAFPALAALLFI